MAKPHCFLTAAASSPGGKKKKKGKTSFLGFNITFQEFFFISVMRLLGTLSSAKVK